MKLGIAPNEYLGNVCLKFGGCSTKSATWWWGLFLTPLRISGTTGRIYKIRMAFDSPVKTVEEIPILLTSESLMTSIGGGALESPLYLGSWAT